MPFWFRKTPETAVAESLVLRSHDMRQVRAIHWSDKRQNENKKPRVGIVLVHPRLDFSHHYAIPRLLEAGFVVLAGSTRHLNNDTMGEHEEMVLDVDAYVRHLKERRGVDKVVLLGNCGGGSLAAYYQAEAKRAPAERTKRSPGGAPTRFDSASMPPADALVYFAAHKGQGKVMLDAIDPSVIDESDPLSVDPSLDMYDAANGFREPPTFSEYDDSFLAKYRAAQRARVARIDEKARLAIAARDEATRASEDPSFSARSPSEQRDILRRRVAEPVMVVYRTMANPAFVDRRIDPSNRDYGSLLSERPDLLNYAALGLARTVTPRAWLSTWSGLSSNADLAKNIAAITEPTLLITPSRDREIYLQDTAIIERAIASTDKRAVTLDARHYFELDPGLGEKAPGGSSPDVERLMDIIVPWILERT